MRKYFLAAFAVLGLLFVGIAPASATGGDKPTYGAGHTLGECSVTLTAWLDGKTSEEWGLLFTVDGAEEFYVPLTAEADASVTLGPEKFGDLEPHTVTYWILGATSPTPIETTPVTLTIDCTPDPEPIEVDLVNPSTVDATCETTAFLNLPDVEGILHYLVNGDPHEPGQVTVGRPSDGPPVVKVVIKPVAVEGYVIPDGAVWKFNIEFPDCPEPTETPTPTPTPTPDPEPDLCAAYADSATWCEDGVEDYNCPDIPDKYKPVILVDAGTDPFGLDGNGNGEGCEGDVPTATPTATASPTETPAPSPDTGDNGELPDTGPETVWLAVLGAGLLAAGSLMLLRTRTNK